MFLNLLVLVLLLLLLEMLLCNLSRLIIQALVLLLVIFSNMSLCSLKNLSCKVLGNLLMPRLWKLSLILIGVNLLMRLVII